MGFIPAEKIPIKSNREGFDYKRSVTAGECIACGDVIIDYSAVEGYILSLEETFGVTVMGSGWDRMNAMSSMQKIESAENPIECTIIKQHSSVLHPATKLLKESILSGKFKYEANLLLENNFENARCTYDTNLNLYVNKKHSAGKVDMVVALINAVYMLMENEVLGDDFVYQCVDL
ncbi:MAG: terminase large subunit [Ruminococcus sp.]|nr:terminase large subunit [Ruminococcus sp.]